MIELLGSIGWGLLACGAITHVWHHGRLRALLAMHLDHEKLPAAALTAIEVALAIAIPVAVLTNSSVLPWLGLAGFTLAAGFILWIGRLLATGSDLPCACSFSDSPTTIWSLARAVCVAFVLAFAFVALDPATTTSQHLATLTVGWAVAGAIFVAPEALAWPRASEALLARVDAHNTGS